MARYICTVCGYIYDEAKGIPEAGVAPGTQWDDLPEDWVCPLCGAVKADFAKQSDQTTASKEKSAPKMNVDYDATELSPLEMSALCSNLARGCDKQYKAEEAALFSDLADYFQTSSNPAENPDFEQLMALIDKDLAEGLPNADAVASDAGDRGAPSGSGLEREGHTHLKVAADTISQRRRRYAEKYRGICLYHLRICLYRR